MNNSSSIAFVGVQKLELLTKEAIEASLAALVAPHEPVISDTSSNDVATPSFGIKIGDRDYSLFAIDFPVPQNDLAVAIQTAYGWKSAAEAVARSTGHWVITPLRSLDNSTSGYEGARDVTTILTALIDTTSVNFVYWTAGDVISTPTAFKAAARGMLATDTLPILSWIQLRLLPGAATGKPGLFGARSVGLRLFGKQEVRLQPEYRSPQEAFSAAMDLVAYVLPEGANVNDCDTVELEGVGVLVARRRAEDDVGFLEFSRLSEA